MTATTSRGEGLKVTDRLLWGRARRAWHEQHGGWPGGLTPLDLLREELAARRRADRERDR